MTIAERKLIHELAKAVAERVPTEGLLRALRKFEDEYSNRQPIPSHYQFPTQAGFKPQTGINHIIAGMVE